MGTNRHEYRQVISEAMDAYSEAKADFAEAKAALAAGEARFEAVIQRLREEAEMPPSRVDKHKE